MGIFGSHFGGTSSFINFTRLRVKLFVLLAAFSFTVAAADVIEDDSLDFSSRDPVSLVKTANPVIRAAFAPKTENITYVLCTNEIEFPSVSVSLVITGFSESHLGRSPPQV